MKKYSELTPREKDQLATQYEPLVNKLVRQYAVSVAMSWNDIKSMAYEGLALAIEKYDEDRSKMDFTQYAAFAIRNNILNCVSSECRTVRMTNYMQNKVSESGETLYTSVSIDRTLRDDDDKKPIEVKLGLVSNETFSDGDTFEYLYQRLEDRFTERDCKMFYMSFGLKNETEELSGKEIAAHYGVSGGFVSQTIKRMVKYIRQDEELCEMLANLMEK